MEQEPQEDKSKGLNVEIYLNIDPNQSLTQEELEILKGMVKHDVTICLEDFLRRHPLK